MPGPRKLNLPDIRAPHERLSLTQYHVAHAFVRGESLAAIGRYLGIHRTTVRRYEIRILQTMGLSTRAQIRSYAEKFGVFGLEKISPRTVKTREIHAEVC